MAVGKLSKSREDLNFLAEVSHIQSSTAAILYHICNPARI